MDLPVTIPFTMYWAFCCWHIKQLKDGGWDRGWKEIGVISGSCRAGSAWVARLRFYTSFTPAFYRLTTATYDSNITKWWTRDRRDFYFRSRYFRFRPGGKPRAFRVNIRADSSYLGPILPELRAEGHTRGFGLGDHFRSGYFRFRWVQGGGTGRRHDNRLASGSNKTRFFFIGKARTLTVNIPKYSENWKIRLTWLLTNLR